MRHKTDTHNLTRGQRLKKKRKRRKIKTIIIVVLLVAISSFIIRELYLNNECKDLYYSANYNLTSTFSNEKLMRVNNMTLIFSDNETAMVDAYGLSTESPHKTIGIRGRFLKSPSGTWELENTYPIEK